MADHVQLAVRMLRKRKSRKKNLNEKKKKKKKKMKISETRTRGLLTQAKHACHHTTTFAWQATYNLLYVWCVRENQGIKKVVLPGIEPACFMLLPSTLPI